MTFPLLAAQSARCVSNNFICAPLRIKRAGPAANPFIPSNLLLKPFVYA